MLVSNGGSEAWLQAGSKCSGEGYAVLLKHNLSKLKMMSIFVCDMLGDVVKIGAGGRWNVKMLFCDVHGNGCGVVNNWCYSWGKSNCFNPNVSNDGTLVDSRRYDTDERFDAACSCLFWILGWPIMKSVVVLLAAGYPLVPKGVAWILGLHIELDESCQFITILQ